MISNLTKLAETLTKMSDEAKTELDGLMAQMDPKQRKEFQEIRNEMREKKANLDADGLMKMAEKLRNKWQRESQV